MGERTEISWAESTFNPWIGCTKVSPGCTNCYAERDMDRRRGFARWGPGQERVRTSSANWRKPLQWNLQARARQDSLEQETPYAERRPYDVGPGAWRVFCASLADWLDHEPPAEWLADLLDLIARTPRLTWMLLTKRPELWRSRITAARDAWKGDPGLVRCLNEWLEGKGHPKNVWLGVSVEDQERANERIPLLMKIPARTRFLSCEPLLGPLKLDKLPALWQDPERPLSCGLEVYPFVGTFAIPDCDIDAGRVSWVIVGGESGPRFRAMDQAWVRSIRDECERHREAWPSEPVAFHFKQWSGLRPKDLDRQLDGRTWDEFPA